MEKKRFDIAAKAAKSIKAADVLGRVVDSLVEKEVARRAQTIEKAIELATQKERELNKFKPDVETYVEGVKQESYSKAKWEEKVKAEAELAKLEEAIETALVGADYKKLYEIVK